MKKKNVIQKALIFAASLVLTFVFAFMFSKSVFADGELITWNDITNNTVRVSSSTVTGKSVSGTLDSSVDAIIYSPDQYSANDSYAGLNNGTFGTSVNINTDGGNKTFSQTVSLTGVDTNGKNVYFYVKSGSDWTEHALTFKIPGETQVNPALSEYYYNGGTLTIAGTITGNTEADVVLISDVTVYGLYSTYYAAETPNITVDGTNYVFTVDRSNLLQSSENSKQYALYAVDNSAHCVVGKTLITICRTPGLDINGGNNTKSVNLSGYNGSVDVGFQLKGYYSGTSVGYSLTNYDRSITDDQTIINNLSDKKGVNENYNYTSLSVALGNSLTLDGTPVYIYLYKGSTIYDVKEIIVKRNSTETDNNYKLYSSDSYNTETDEFTLLATRNYVDTYFKLSNISGKYGQSQNSGNPQNPYRVVIAETATGNVVATSDGLYWTREENGHNDFWGNWVVDSYNYKLNIRINNLDNFPTAGKDYTANLQYKTTNGQGQEIIVDIGQSIDFSINNETTKMVWQNYSPENSSIVLPIYKPEALEAQIMGSRATDVFAWNTELLTGDELTAWADAVTSTYSIYTDGDLKKVSIPVSDLPRVNTHIYFYLIRNKGNDALETEAIPLENYPVTIRGIVNRFGPYMMNSKLDNKVYKIGDEYYYFWGSLQDSSEHSIVGYYENGMGIDEIAWTEETLTDEELQEWENNANLHMHSSPLQFVTNPPGTTYYYTYNIPLESYSNLAEGETKNISIFTRRNLGNGAFQYTKLGEVKVQKAHSPELTSVNSTVKYTYGYKNSTKDIRISLTANDVDTGIKEILLYKNINDNAAPAVLYSKNNDEFAPNQSVPINYDLKGIKNDEDKYVTIVIKNFNGRETTYQGLFASKPDLIVKPVNELESFGRQDYYTSDTRNEIFEITAKKNNEQNSSDEEDKAEIAKLLVEVNGIKIINEDYSELNESEISEKINLADSRIPDAADNKYKIYVKVTNKYDNVAENSFDFEVDKDKPEITGFIVNGREMPSDADTSRYTFITNQRTETEIKASDSGSGGLKDIKYYWQEVGGNKSQETIQEIESHPEKASIKTTKDSSYKGFLYANAEDMVGNKADKYVTFGGIIVETGDKHNAENHIDIGVPDSGAKDRKGNPLYNKATTFSIRVNDNFSGIRSVEWRVSSPHDESMNASGSVNISEGNLSDGSWSKNGSDKNIVTAISKSISVDGNSDDCVLYVRMVDNAGNASEKSVSFSIDKVKPTISVTYGNQTGDPDFTNYYADNRTATIVVKERNFNQDSANAIISNSTGNKGTLSGWTEKRDDANPDNSTYTATVTFDKDDRYNLTFQCSDRAGNAADAVTTTEFVIDKTVPVVTVAFDNGNGRNGYYANARTATISVKDVNFDAGRVTITGVNGQAFTLSNWTRKDNTFSALMTFSTDGVFAFDISAKDKAGNQSNSVHENKFTIDLEKPEIIIEGVEDKSANNGTVAPKITFKDTNIDKDTISVEINGANNGRVDLTDKYLVSEDGLVYTFKNIENVKENDDLYTLRATVKDLAGNVTTEEIKFSVNRFGSIYILGENLKNINDKYVKTVKGIDITEINVNKIKKGSVVITLTVNGVPNTLVEGTDYKIDAEESEGDWNQYKYRFEDSLFVKDGSYILAVVSEDEAGNKNNNGNETKEAEVKFGVDSTAPIVAPVNFEANKYYDSNGMDLSVSVKDNMVLDSVTVYIDGQQVSCTQDGEIYTFHIDESNRRQEVKVVAKDLAGNETIESYEGLLIAGNFIVRFFHNKLAIIIASASGGTLVIGGGILLSLRLFRRKI